MDESLSASGVHQTSSGAYVCCYQELAKQPYPHGYFCATCATFYVERSYNDLVPVQYRPTHAAVGLCITGALIAIFLSIGYFLLQGIR